MRVLPILALASASVTGGVMLACGTTTVEQEPAPVAIADPNATPPDQSGMTDKPAPVAFPAPHPAMPQVTSSGGPVLANPKVVPIFFPGFEFEMPVVDFAGKIGKSAYWKAIAAEYGVGTLTTATAIDIADPPDATITDAQIQEWLRARFDGTHPEFGSTPEKDAIYTLFFPPTTTIYLGAAPVTNDGGVEAGTDGGHPSRGQSSCRSFGGYHSDTKINGVSVSYAVIPQCSSFGPLKGVDVVTSTPSHEWIEAATDPFPMSNAAYATVDDDHLTWNALGAGEVGDMCAQYDSSFYKDTEIGYTVQRSWSNAAAAAGKEPCVPALPNEPPYFNAAPRMKDDVMVSAGSTKGVTVPIGKSKTIEVDLFSSAPTSGPWTVGVAAQSFGAPSGSGGTSTPPVTFALDKTQGVNGDKINVTITANSASTSRSGTTTFIITSTLGSEKHYWAGVVGN
jgi:hypothetical protein